MAKDQTGAGVAKAFARAPSVCALVQKPPKAIAVALSGGPDSMALLALLSLLRDDGTIIHAITVDHQLRPESPHEARMVGAWVRHWPGVVHHTLKWTGAKPKTGIMEAARNARYRLIENWCAKNNVKQLWLGHNQTDQVETFLFRLAKGSGLDGLGGMEETQTRGKIELVRPMLNIAKDQLQSFCIENKIAFVQDPTNTNMKYARSRLRQSLPVLEEEGLSERRLAATVARLARARDALDHYTNDVLRKGATIGPNQSTLKMTTLIKAPQDIRIRAVRSALHEMGVDGYGPRLDRLEDCLDIFFADGEKAKRFTLGGFVFANDRKNGVLTIKREK